MHHMRAREKEACRKGEGRGEGVDPKYTCIPAADSQPARQKKVERRVGWTVEHKLPPQPPSWRGMGYRGALTAHLLEERRCGRPLPRLG